MHRFPVFSVVLLLCTSGYCLAEPATPTATVCTKATLAACCPSASTAECPASCVTGTSCPAERTVANNTPHTTCENACPNKLDAKPLTLRRTEPPQHQPAIATTVEPPAKASVQAKPWTPATQLPAIVACPQPIQPARPATVQNAGKKTFQLHVNMMPRPQRGLYAKSLQEHYSAERAANSLEHLNQAALHLEAAGLGAEATAIRNQIKLTKNRLTRELIRKKTAELNELQAEIKRLQNEVHPRQVTVAATIAEIPAASFAQVKHKLEQQLHNHHGEKPDVAKVLQSLYGKEVRVLSKPVIIVQEGQPGEISVAQASPWIPVNHTPGQSAIQQVSAQQYGLHLEVKPFVQSTGNVELKARLQVTTHDHKAHGIREVLDQSFSPVAAEGKTVAILTRPHHYVSQEAFLANKGKCYLITLQPKLSPISAFSAPAGSSF